MNVVCPWCDCQIWIEEVNCRIFRHAVYKVSGEPINPHATEEECNRLLKEEIVFGCAKPFRLNEQNETERCEYI